MSVFRAGELLGVDSVTTLKKMAVGEGDPADPAFLDMRQQQAAAAGTPDSFGPAPTPTEHVSPAPTGVSTADMLNNLGDASGQLNEMGEDIKKTVQRLFLQAETASYGLPPAATSTVKGSSGSSGSGGGQA